VVPEFTADVGTKKGEKVDYAIMRDGSPLLLFEAKWVGVSLKDNHMSQLYRYFSVTDARIGVLTNGLLYRFFMDLDETNKMDARPFFEFDLLDYNEFDLAQLQRFAKEGIDVAGMASAAAEMRYTREIRAVFESEATDPSDEFIRYFVSATGAGRLTKSIREVFRPLIVKAIRQYIADQISSRLHTALSQNAADRPADPAPVTSTNAEPETASTSTAPAPAAAAEPLPSREQDGIETTEEELMGFHIVRAIVAQVAEPTRVTLRDAKSYCSILFDDNNRKPLCRLRFNAASVKYLGLFDEQKNEQRVQIDAVTDIYHHAPRIIEAAKRWS
jgi:predicted type IV restriction endonuclease